MCATWGDGLSVKRLTTPEDYRSKSFAGRKKAAKHLEVLFSERMVKNKKLLDQ